METIIFVLIILALAGGAIWYYNRTNPGADVNGDGQIDANDAKAALQNTALGLVKDARDARDLAMSLASESAGRAINAVETVTKTQRATAKKSDTKKPAAKKPATKATKPAARATKPRTKKSV
jgi:preprotein translocase subunit SecF